MVDVITAVGSVVAMLAMPLGAPTPTATDRTVAAPRIEVAAINGSGCPAGTATAWSTPDGDAVMVSFDQFTARAGGGVSPIDQRKNCQVGLRVDNPADWSFALEGIEAAGYADLQSQAVGMHRTTAYFAGEAAQTQVSDTRTGPLHGTWQSSDTFATPLFSPCGTTRNLNVNTELRVRSDSPDQVSSLELSAVVMYRLTWRPC
ncbi:DUF4360 domain-containing protein [Krasilnikovia sp. MM14-A1259]|uniref:DUF4360 domain-containing protein n=1 Tax=Krasilnikovia sp. MM14-A1259 TaxID=3373539 RepID=UPI0037F65355